MKIERNAKKKNDFFYISEMSLTFIKGERFNVHYFFFCF